MAITRTARTAALLAGPLARFKDLTPATARDDLGLGTAALLNLASPFLKFKLVTGGAAGNLTVTGIKTTDSLRLVLKFTGAGTAVTALADLTSEFTITGADTINNTAGTTTASSQVLVVWVSPS